MAYNLTETEANTIQDILTALEKNPGLQEELWRRLATPRMLNLPVTVDEILTRQARTEERQGRLEEAMAKLAEGQARMEERQARMEERQDRLEVAMAKLAEGQAKLEDTMAKLAEGQAKLEDTMAKLAERQDRLETDVKEIKGEVKRLRGTDYQRRAASRARRKTRKQLGMTSPQVIHLDSDMERNAALRIVEDAEHQNLLSGDDAEDLEVIDLIIQDGASGDYAAGEISITLDAENAVKAGRRARLLATATGRKVNPIVVGAMVLDGCREQAEKLEVTIITVHDEA